MNTHHLELPIDSASAARLAQDGLRFGLVDRTDPIAFASWSQSVSRGFHAPRDTQEQLDQRLSFYANRRMSGVWDDSEADAASPVATIDAWPSDLTVPGRSSVPAWAISAVTVSPTHRRRGIATALLEAELRTASALGFPVAMLTVSESTIYGRFGFGPALNVTELTIDTRRTKWTGPVATGRVQFVTKEQLLIDGHALVEKVRLDTPGHMEYSGVLWERQLGVMAGDENAKSLRFVRYDDADGVQQGFAIYRIIDTGKDFADHELKLTYLVAATDDAYAGLWRFMLEMDLVSKLTADLRPLDEPLRWMISDVRAIHTNDIDHLWTRILDVKAALEARTYESEGRIVLAVTDRLGFAEGTFALEVADSGAAVVTEVDEPADVTLSATELGSIYLGGVSPLALARADRITGDAALLATMFGSPVAPWLDIWF